jgi:hypothetical protein
MNRISRLAVIAIAAAAVATPALAQSFDPKFGANAYALVPADDGGSALHPAATGGGSVGYNETLRRNQW